MFTNLSALDQRRYCGEARATAYILTAVNRSQCTTLLPSAYYQFVYLEPEYCLSFKQERRSYGVSQRIVNPESLSALSLLFTELTESFTYLYDPVPIVESSSAYGLFYLSFHYGSTTVHFDGTSIISIRNIQLF